MANSKFAPGSSLGGARPKADVTDENQYPWIAKFPGKNDTTDIGLWEMIVHDLAIKAGITVPQAQVKQFKSKYPRIYPNGLTGRKQRKEFTILRL